MLHPQPTLDERIEKRTRATVLHTLYDLLRCEELVNIATMSYDEFEAFVERVQSGEDE